MALVMALACAAASAVDVAQQFFAGLKTLAADFEQTVYDADGVQIQQTRGSLFIARPDRFRWDYLQPFHQLIIADGRKIWLYDEDLEQVTVKPLQQALTSTPALLLSSDKPLTDSFSIETLPTKNNLSWVRLVPRSKDTTFANIDLAFASNQLAQMELHDSLGNTTVILFDKLRRNIAIAERQFEFTPPPGVDVVGETADILDAD